MSNKPMTQAVTADGYELHDVSDPRCEHHAKAKRWKNIRVRPERNCPSCVSVEQHHGRARRRATRAEAAA